MCSPVILAPGAFCAQQRSDTSPLPLHCPPPPRSRPRSTLTTLVLMSHTQVLKKIYPKIYNSLCPNNKLSDLAELVKEWLSLERAPPVSGRAGGPRGQRLVSYPVVGRVLVDDLEALVAADIPAWGDSSMGSTSTPPAVQPPPTLVAPPQAASASGGSVSAIAATPAAYGFEEGSAEAVWLRHILATARADAAESAAMDRDQTEMHFCREAWLSVLNYHYEDDISYDEYIQCCKERGPDAADAMFVDRAQSRLPERGASPAAARRRQGRPPPTP